MSISKEYPTKPTTEDLAHAIAKMGLSAIPGIGGTAVEVFQFLIQSPIERRRDTFVQQLGEKFLELEARGIKWENLQQNEQFISVVLHASQAALRTHQTEKLAALRNAITNVAQDKNLDDTLLHVLLSHIDTLSEMHLRILKVFQAPKVPSEWDGDRQLHPVYELVSHNMPELKGSEIGQLLMIDLNNRGLMAVELHQGQSAEGWRRSHITFLGESLLRLIAGQ